MTKFPLPVVRTFVDQYGVQFAGHGPVIEMPGGETIELPNVTTVTGFVGPHEVSKVTIELLAVHVTETIERTRPTFVDGLKP